MTVLFFIAIHMRLFKSFSGKSGDTFFKEGVHSFPMIRRPCQPGRAFYLLDHAGMELRKHGLIQSQLYLRIGLHRPTGQLPGQSGYCFGQFLTTPGAGDESPLCRLLAAEPLSGHEKFRGPRKSNTRWSHN